MTRIIKGIVVLLFAILLQLCSTGMDLFTLGIGVVGLVMALTGVAKQE